VTSILLGKVIEEGSITVPYAACMNIVGNLTAERINLDAANGKLSIATDAYDASIQGIPSEEFPIIPNLKEPLGSMKLKGETLKQALAQVSGAAQQSDLRPELGSIQIAYTIENLICAATDGFRLAERKIPSSQITSTYESSFSVLLPIRAATELARILPVEEEIQLATDAHQLSIETPSLTFISRLIDGRFPEYDAIVPKSFACEAIVDKDEFLSTLKLASALGGKQNEVRITVVSDKKSIEVRAMEQGVGEQVSLIPSRIKEGTEGKEKSTSFNLKYLTEGVRAIKTEELWMGFGEDQKPAVLKGDKDASFFYLIAPIVRT
jgi:DNA polymerase-3 subunit beta